MSSLGGMRTRTIGRSPEMPYFHSSRWPRRFWRSHPPRAARDRRRAAGRRGAESASCRRRSGRDAAARSGCGCWRVPARARRHGDRDISRSARASASLSRKPVVNASRAVPPGGSRMDCAQADDRIEDRARRVRKARAAREQRGRARQRPAASDEARAIGLGTRSPTQHGRGH